MPQSLSHILIHLVFSTKGRAPWLDQDVRPRMHAYLAGVVRECGCTCHRVGGVEDHVHLAIHMARTLSVSDLVEKVKVSSSKWAKSQGLPEFSWQRGYAAFSLGRTELPALLAYIDGQEAHHRNEEFKVEYRALLVEFGIEFDEQYMWD